MDRATAELRYVLAWVRLHAASPAEAGRLTPEELQDLFDMLPNPHRTLGQFALEVEAREQAQARASAELEEARKREHNESVVHAFQSAHPENKG